MAQPKLSKPQSSSDKKLHIAVIVCIVLVIASFIGNILLIRYSFEISNNEFHRHVNLVQSRLREVNLRVQNDPKNEEEIEMLNDTVENDK